MLCHISSDRLSTICCCLYVHLNNILFFESKRAFDIKKKKQITQVHYIAKECKVKPHFVLWAIWLSMITLGLFIYVPTCKICSLKNKLHKHIKHVQ